MSTLTDQIRHDDAQARKQNLERYSELLHRADDPQPGDAAQLRELLKALDITVKAFEADAAAAAKYVEAERHEQDALAASRDPALHEEIKTARARVDALQKELREAELERNRAMLKLDQAQKAHADAITERRELRQRHPRAFGEEPPAPAGPHIGQMRKQRELGPDR